MKVKTILIFLLAVVIGLACLKSVPGEGRAVSRDESILTRPPIMPCLFLLLGSDKELLATETIDSTGGTLSSEDFSLVVPADAFSAATELKLYLVKEQNPLGNSKISELFRVEGLPADYAKPLTLTIGYDGTISGEGYVAIGEDAINYATDEKIVSYQMLEAQEASGFLTVEVPTTSKSTAAMARVPEASSDAGMRISLNAAAVDIQIALLSDEGHFKLYDLAPSTGDPEDRYRLLTYLEEAYSKLQALGFSYNNRRDFTANPVKVHLKESTWNENSWSDGNFVSSWWGGGYLEMRAYRPGDYLEYKQVAGHHFFHLVQDLYDPPPDSLWLNEAAATWFENTYCKEDISYHPINWGYQRVMSTLAQMHKGIGKEGTRFDTIVHGYNKAVMIKYLLKRFGDEQKLAQMYTHIENGDHPVEAVIKSTEDPVIWLDDFYMKWIQNDDKLSEDYYHLLLINLVDLIGFKLKLDPQFKQETYPLHLDDLSGYPGTVQLDANTEKVSFSVSGGIDSAIAVAKYKIVALDEKYIVFLDDHSDTVTVENLRSLSQDGWDLLFLITNRKVASPYTGNSIIDLTIEAESSYYQFPLSYKGQGKYKVTYHIVYGEEVDFPCSSDTEYYVTLSGNGAVQISYDANTKLGPFPDILLTCVDTHAPGPVPGNCQHDSAGSFRCENTTPGCSIPNVLEGTFTENKISGKGSYYECSYGEVLTTQEIEFTDIPSQ